MKVFCFLILNYYIFCIKYEADKNKLLTCLRLDCRRRNAFRDFTIKAEVAHVLQKGAEDEAGLCPPSPPPPPFLPLPPLFLLGMPCYFFLQIPFPFLF